jgi:hypothetical protein
MDVPAAVAAEVERDLRSGHHAYAARPTTGTRRCTQESGLLGMASIAAERCAQTASPLRRLLQAPSSKRPAPLPVAPWCLMSSSPLCCPQIGICT